jgi:hypothetical protein
VAKVKDRALQTATSFQMLFGLLQVVSDTFGVFFKCFAKQDRLTDVPTNCRAPAKDLGQSSRS